MSIIPLRWDNSESLNLPDNQDRRTSRLRGVEGASTLLGIRFAGRVIIADLTADVDYLVGDIAGTVVITFTSVFNTITSENSRTSSTVMGRLQEPWLGGRDQLSAPFQARETSTALIRSS